MLDILIGVIVSLSLLGMYRYSIDIMHPHFWTNFFFLLYGISFIYLRIEGVEAAVFIRLAGLKIDFYQYLTFSAAIVLISKLSIEFLGTISDDFVANCRHNILRVANYDLFIIRIFAVIFFIIGFLYWIYVILSINNGSFAIFSNIGIWEYVIEDSGLSTIWYQFAFIGAQVWFLSFFLSKNNHSFNKYILYVPAFIILLSTGRLSQSFLFLLTPVLFGIFFNEGVVPLKRVARLATFGAVAIIILYFYRDFTSYSYIGREGAFFELIGGQEAALNIIRSLVGSGNLPDPQQIILILHGVLNGKLDWTYGATYFDWVVNFLTDWDTRSVGYRILNAYFPEKSGGPTPGAAGEALLNFGPFFPIFLMLVGYAFVRFYRYARTSHGVLVRFLYVKTLLHFWVLFIKVDSSLIEGLLWEIAPITVVWLVLVHGFRPLSRSRNPKEGLSSA